MKAGSAARHRRDVRVMAAVVAGLLVAVCDGGPPANAEPAEESPRYTVRLDGGRHDPGRFELTEEQGEVHVLTGPAGIAYRAEDAVMSGAYRLAATFALRGAPVGYHEAYGVFVGGRDLGGPGLHYTYFVIRPTGEYLVKRRAGDSTEVVVDWTAHEAIEAMRVEGDQPRNALAVEVGGGEVRFVVNDDTVHTMPVADARPYGLAGIRVNHRLDVRVSNWRIGKPGET